MLGADTGHNPGLEGRGASEGTDGICGQGSLATPRALTAAEQTSLGSYFKYTSGRSK